MPVFDGKLRNSSIAASNPPADPPTPTIGQIEFLLSGFAFDFALARFNRGNFVLFAFLCERDALVLAFRFAMALVDVSCVSHLIQASIPIVTADLERRCVFSCTGGLRNRSNGTVRNCRCSKYACVN